MARFYFVIQGKNILLDRQGADPVIGFVALRERRGKTRQEAEKLVKIELLKQWRQTFNQDNKAGTPSLELVHCRKILSPFKKVRVSDDFRFFSDSELQHTLVESAIKSGKNWFGIS